MTEITKINEQTEVYKKETLASKDQNGGDGGDDVYLLTENQREMLGLEDDTVDAIQDVFRSLDKDSSGYLDVSELETAMRSMGTESTKQEIDALVSQIDIDGNGCVDIFEFAKMVSEKLKDYDPERELLEAFAVFDKNGDGMVDIDEIKSVVESLGGEMTKEELEGMFKEADENNDGYIDYEEFVKIWIGSQEDKNKAGKD